MINIHKLIFSRCMEFKVTLNTPLDFWVVQTQILNKFVGKTLIKIYALKDERNVVPPLWDSSIYYRHCYCANEFALHNHVTLIKLYLK